MGSLSRKIKRQQQKSHYKKFSDAWLRGKRMQSEQEKLGLKLDQPKLGRRPTFKMWVSAGEDMVRKMAAAEAERRAAEEKEIGTDWEEPTIELPAVGVEDTASESQEKETKAPEVRLPYVQGL